MIGLDLTPLAYEARLAALADAGVGLWDVAARARRRGSLDAAMTDIACNDLAALVAALPMLGCVAFNGGKAFRLGAGRVGNTPTQLLPSSSPAHTIAFEAKRTAWMALRAWIAPALPSS